MFQSILAAVHYYISGEKDGLTREQVELVQDSWREVSKDKEKAGLAFYNRLFIANPELLDIFSFGKEFKNDMDGEGSKLQGMKLMNMIGTAVSGLDDLETIIPTVKKLGKRHNVYGVQEKHFQPVGDALIWVLQESQGDKFTEDHLEAWAIVYKVLTETMIEGMKET